MPSVTMPRAITPSEGAGALQQQHDTGYQVTPHRNDSLAVKHGSLAFATVRLSRDGNVTTFRVHGGGLIIGRIVNEFAIARTVAATIKEAFRPVPAS